MSPSQPCEQPERVALVAARRFEREQRGSASRARDRHRVRLDPRHRGDVVHARHPPIAPRRDAPGTARGSRCRSGAGSRRRGSGCSPSPGSRARDRPPTAARRTGSIRPTRDRRSSPAPGQCRRRARRTGNARALVADRAVHVGVHEVLARTGHAPDGAAELVEARRASQRRGRATAGCRIQARPSQRVRVGRRERDVSVCMSPTTAVSMIGPWRVCRTSTTTGSEVPRTWISSRWIVSGSHEPRCSAAVRSSFRRST